MTHNELIGQAVANILPGYRVYNVRGLTLTEFLEQQAVEMSQPGIFVSIGQWIGDERELLDTGTVTRYQRRSTVYLAGSKTGEDDVDTLIDAQSDPSKMRYERDGNTFGLTLIQAEDEEGETGFPCISIYFDVSTI